MTGYVVQTADHFLIFDYIELEEEPTKCGLDMGFVDPAEIADRAVTVFVTNSHLDRYDEIILGWQEQIENIRYIFGWQVEEGPGRYSLPASRAELELAGLSIHTVNSHHSGVAEVGYLIQADGLVLFHAGDYQGRMGRGEPSNAVADMRYLRTKADRVDLLFLGAWTGDLSGQTGRLVRPARRCDRIGRLVRKNSQCTRLHWSSLRCVLARELPVERLHRAPGLGLGRDGVVDGDRHEAAATVSVDHQEVPAVGGGGVVFGALGWGRSVVIDEVARLTSNWALPMAYRSMAPSQVSLGGGSRQGSVGRT
ncbi:MAG: hypothetical protein ABIF77_04825 [bacterium]